MTDPSLEAVLLPMLRAEEGTRLLAYDDATGKPIGPGSNVVGHPTIGIGRALDVHGISESEADYLLTNDIAGICAQLNAALPWWLGMTTNRQAVLAAMVFQLGLKGTMAFLNTLEAMRAHRYGDAATGMLASAWARQTPERVRRMAALMRRG